MRETTVLLVEGRRAGEASLATAIENKWGLRLVHTGAEACAALLNDAIHAIVINATSMRSPGWRTLNKIRRASPWLPIIHCRAAGEPLPAAGELPVRVHTLEMPFTSRKVINKLRQLLPDVNGQRVALRRGNVVLFPDQGTVQVNGYVAKPLTPKNQALLQLLMERAGETVSRSELMRHVWQTDYVDDTRTLDTHIRLLRKSIEENPKLPSRIVTVRGKGYMFRP